MKKQTWCLWTVLVTLMDQALKHWLRQVDLVLIPGVIKLEYAKNTGVAFSLMENHGGLVTALTLFVILAMAVYGLKRCGSMPHALAGILMVGGASGNLVDRLMRGYVSDYIRILLFDHPIFNFADICILAGTALTLVLLIKEPTKGKTNGHH